MTFFDLFNRATSAAVEDLRTGQFVLESKTDILALIFHHATALAKSYSLPLKIHVEPTKLALKPDLVFGDEEVFVQVKFARAGSGEPRNTLRKWRGHVWKLRRYKSEWPQARCVLLAVCEAADHAVSERADFIDPAAVKLKGAWAHLTEGSRFLLAEL